MHGTHVLSLTGGGYTTHTYGTHVLSLIGRGFTTHTYGTHGLSLTGSTWKENTTMFLKRGHVRTFTLQYIIA